MLVVVAVLLVLLTLAVAFGPWVHERQKVTGGADQLQQWLLTSKGRARSARLPCGVRLRPLPAVTLSPLPVMAGPGQVVTPLAMSGLVDGLPWQILPGAVVIVSDPDPANPSGTVNPEPVSVLAVIGPSFQANFTRDHPAGFVIQVLAYVKDLEYIEQPDDFVCKPGIAARPGSDPLPGL